MGVLRELLRVYSVQLLAAALFLPALIQHLLIGRWEDHAVPMAAAVFGLACAAASEEVADWTGDYGWTYESFFTYPPAWIRTSGFITLVAIDLFGFRP